MIRKKESPVDIPDSGSVVHRAGGEEVSTGMPGAAPYLRKYIIRKKT